MNFIEAMHLFFNYKTYVSEKEKPIEKTVLKDVDISVNKGDFIGIVGENGSGKSTLAKQLSGLLFPSRGVVCIDGIDTSKKEMIFSVRKKAGMVFQNPDNQLIGNVVEEDVAFGPENLGVPTDQIWKRVSDALEATGMTAFRESSPSALSGGQKQKTAIAGILAMEPECIILDEPTAMLDPLCRKEVLETIWSLNRKKKITIILITHYVEEVEDADYLYLMNHGEIVFEGVPDLLWEQKELLEKYQVESPFYRKLMMLLRSGGLEIPDTLRKKEELLQFLLEQRN